MICDSCCLGSADPGVVAGLPPLASSQVRCRSTAAGRRGRRRRSPGPPSPVARAPPVAGAAAAGRRSKLARRSDGSGARQTGVVASRWPDARRTADPATRPGEPAAERPAHPLDRHQRNAGGLLARGLLRRVRQLAARRRSGREYRGAPDAHARFALDGDGALQGRRTERYVPARKPPQHPPPGAAGVQRAAHGRPRCSTSSATAACSTGGRGT